MTKKKPGRKGKYLVGRFVVKREKHGLNTDGAVN